MLYVKALLEPLTELPESNAEIRAEIDAQAKQHGWAYLHAQLAQFDPVTAERLKPTDAQRINRAIEIYRISGKPMSQWWAEDKSSGQSHTLPFTPILTALIPEPRSVLHERINQRFLNMVEQGFLDEMRALRARGDLTEEMPSMRCVGYRQAWEFLEGAVDYNTFIDKGQAATRQLAKRQMTWIRGMPEIQTFSELDVNGLNRLLSL